MDKYRLEIVYRRKSISLMGEYTSVDHAGRDIGILMLGSAFPGALAYRVVNQRGEVVLFQEIAH